MNRIESERRAAGLKREQLAGVLGVHPNTVKGWEQGFFEPNGRNLIQLSTLFGCSPDYLLGLTDRKSLQGIDSGAEPERASR